MYENDRAERRSIQWALCTTLYIFTRRNNRIRGERNVHFSSGVLFPESSQLFSFKRLFPKRITKHTPSLTRGGVRVSETNCLFPVGLGLGLSDLSLCWPTNKSSCPSQQLGEVRSTDTYSQPQSTPSSSLCYSTSTSRYFELVPSYSHYQIIIIPLSIYYEEQSEKIAYYGEHWRNFEK